MQPSPYHAGLAGRCPQRLQAAPASTACCCPVGLSATSQPLTQGSFLPNPSCLRQESHRLVMRRTLINSSGSPVIRGRTAAALVLHLRAMNGMVMAVPAHHQGLPLARGHVADPGRWLAFPRSAKILQLPDVMDLNLLLRAA